MIEETKKECENMRGILGNGPIYRSVAMLYNLVTMDELVVAFHTTETKE
jgi:hypothetical protein